MDTMLFFLTILHLVAGVGFLARFYVKRTLVYFHLGVGTLIIGAGMLAVWFFW